MRNSQESALKTAQGNVHELAPTTTGAEMAAAAPFQVAREPKSAAERMAARMRMFIKPIIRDPSISDDVREQISKIPPDEIEKYRLVDMDGVKKLVRIDDRDPAIPAVSP